MWFFKCSLVKEMVLCKTMTSTKNYFFVWWNCSSDWWGTCCTLFYVEPFWKGFYIVPKGFCYCYDVMLATLEELLVLLQNLMQPILHQSEELFHHTWNHLSMQMFFWVFLVLYITIVFTKEPKMGMTQTSAWQGNFGGLLLQLVNKQLWGRPYQMVSSSCLSLSLSLSHSLALSFVRLWFPCRSVRVSRSEGELCKGVCVCMCV